MINRVLTVILCTTPSLSSKQLTYSVRGSTVDRAGSLTTAVRPIWALDLFSRWKMFSICTKREFVACEINHMRELAIFVRVDGHARTCDTKYLRKAIAHSNFQSQSKRFWHSLSIWSFCMLQSENDSPHRLLRLILRPMGALRLRL